MMHDSRDYAHELFLITPGPRPPFFEVVIHVYGPNDTVDTDGDSRLREATDWTWLYMQLRKPPYREQPVVEVAMLEGKNVMRIASDEADLAERTAVFLASQAGGTISRKLPT
ncbi:hypothetical protein [Novosphingobium sp.]|uniref:hypothetical protein n=1 Tax=Novosphingobium sp. TaxID=1874826 RepID=UPI00333F2857